MQIFVLDENPILCAQYHANKHVIKQILETCQLLCTTMRIHNIEYGYKITHKNHPCRKWLDESKENFMWLKKLGIELCKEYNIRYNRIHNSQKIIENSYPPNFLPKKTLTNFALTMPEQYKSNNVVNSYRNYYIADKRHLLCYSKREIPYWLKGIIS